MPQNDLTLETLEVYNNGMRDSRCLSFAYLELSRSFYSLFIIVMSRIAGEGAVGTSLLVFNIAMACVHVINVVYFSRLSVAALFTIAEDGMVTAA